MSDILVSINCTAYNHEDYIADAIEGFLMQKTNFKYEVLIHDDASKDGTANIIRKYEEKYPDIIKPVYQTENQYSKGVRVGYFNGKRAIGKYIAICEGDDYWIDPYKLQKQVDYMEENPDCSLCFHNAVLVNKDKEPTGKLQVPYSFFNKKYYYGKSRKYDAGELALLDFIPTASLMFPRKFVDEFPDFYFKSIYGDLPMRLFLAHKGYAYFINEAMSAYRIAVPGSALDVLNRTREDRLRHLHGYIDILSNFDKYSNEKYHSEIEKAKLIRHFTFLMSEGNSKIKNDPKYRTLYDELTVLTKIKFNLRINFPNIYKYLVRMKEIF